MRMCREYSILRLSREFNVTPRALRFYEDKGLLRPTRQGRSRLYSERDRTRLRLTLRGKRLGFTLEECREIIDMHDPARPHDARQLLRLCEKIREHRVKLLRKLHDLEETLFAMDRVEAQCLSELQSRIGVNS